MVKLAHETAGAWLLISIAAGSANGQISPGPDEHCFEVAAPVVDPLQNSWATTKSDVPRFAVKWLDTRSMQQFMALINHTQGPASGLVSHRSSSCCDGRSRVHCKHFTIEQSHQALKVFDLVRGGSG